MSTYAETEPFARQALERIRREIDQTVARLGDADLVQAAAAPRIKSDVSLARQARREGWSPDEAALKAPDLVGCRIVCRYLYDVLRAADLLEATLRGDARDLQRRDYTERPTSTGYRGVHLVFRLPATIGDREVHVGCEIQIRSRLQESWVELSKADVQSTDAPVPAAGAALLRLSLLSDVLARADKIADRIREDLVRPRRGRSAPGDRPLTESAIAFLYRRSFGFDPPDYLVQTVLHEAEGTRLTTGGLQAALDDETFVRRLADDRAKTADREKAPEQMFRCVVRSLVRDADAVRPTGERRGPRAGSPPPSPSTAPESGSK
jgi:ppGpp synthetase/RelA/SpoT-type nucleotidyltranferase